MVIVSYDDDGFPAERAVGVGLKPRVDAVDVEGVAARRQQPEPLAVAEVGQANGALLAAAHRLLTAAAVPEGGAHRGMCGSLC